MNPLLRFKKTNSVPSGGWKKVVSVLILLFAMPLVLLASHFRYGNISWRWVSARTIEFKVSQAWRYSYFNPSLGATVTTDVLYFGDGSAANVNLKVTAVNIAEDWFYGEATITKTYSANGNFTAYFTNCCKISTLQNNRDASWRGETLVTVGNNNSSPVSTTPAIVNLPVNQSNASFTIAAADPDGDALSFRLATNAEFLGSQPAGFSVNASGVATFNTVGKTVGHLYNAAVAISDSKNAKTMVDFIIKITPPSTPPAFDYSVTPNNGRVYQVSPGQNVSFSVKASDSDPGDLVSLQAVGVPPGAALSPLLPITANPVQTAFSWTPSSTNLGTNVVNFIAQDNQGVQRTSSVTIIVSLKPVFDVPPTPAAGSLTYTLYQSRCHRYPYGPGFRSGPVG
jgi:hypothetical protein